MLIGSPQSLRSLYGKLLFVADIEPLYNNLKLFLIIENVEDFIEYKI